MNLNLVPFGKANYTHAGENYTFNCHHGEKECMGNKVHACALKKIMDMDMQVKFINCVMTMNAEKKPEEYPTKMCANDVKLAADVTSQLESCATSNEGDALLAEFGDMTMKFQNPLKSVPSVTFTNEPNKDNAEATSNFRMALCSQIMDPKPAICNKNSASSYHSSLFLVPLTYFFTLKL
ncbi:hypothetical protein O3M35_001908 [Rhynocoris fuscipes]|uniref:Gamma-interferon-inducible lysosomal thiol reductase n=1 Tax=Rhynocoris fuscipes TaxID=488301 RepID=A0AAW1CQK0_9HEMI